MADERDEDAWPPPPRRCPACGAPLIDLCCPACLMALALGPDVEKETDADAGPPEPGYRVMTVIARGPDRTVYLAEDDRSRALVTLDLAEPQSAAASAAAFADRLGRLLRLVHPGIARIRDGRLTDAGAFCVVADYIVGLRIDRYCESRGLSRVARTELFVALCEAIECAHDLGAPHGRLTEEAIVVTGEGEVAVPVISGFGMWTARPPSASDDLEALGLLAVHLGVTGTVPPCESLGALRRAVTPH